MTTAIEPRGPPRVLIRLANPVVRTLLRSPLHALLDPGVLLLHVTGRKTGREYTIPVSFTDIDGQLTVVTADRWRLNLRDSKDVEVTWHGRRRRVRARLHEDPASVAVAYRQIIDRLGWPRAGHRLGISPAHAAMPTMSELKEAARQYDWSVIKITPR